MQGVITGTAYGRRATLEVAGDTLTWRAQRGVAENIVTTIHDVRFARWLSQRTSWLGVALGGLGALWLVTEHALVGYTGLGAAGALLAWRATHPRMYLLLDVGDMRLVLRVPPVHAAAARSLAERIDDALATGVPPAQPPTLP